MKKIFKFTIFWGFLLIPLVCFGAGAYHCSGGLTGGGLNSLDGISNPIDNSMAIVHFNGDATYGNSVFVYTFDIDASAGEFVPFIIAPDIGSGEWELVLERDSQSLPFTNGETNTEFTTVAMIKYKGFSNLGASGETDIYLDDPSYPFRLIFTVSESYITEICPPTGELFDHDGTPLNVNDCIDTSAVPGDKLAFTRMQITGGTWRWSTDTIRGVHIDTDATD